VPCHAGDGPDAVAGVSQFEDQGDARRSIVRTGALGIVLLTNATCLLGRRRRGGELTPRLLDDLAYRAHDQAGLMEQAELVRSLGPDTGDGFRIKGRTVGDHLLGAQPHPPESIQKLPHIISTDGAMDQLIANQPITPLARGVDCHEQRKPVLVDLIDAENARERFDDPGLIGLVQADGSAVAATPVSHGGLTGTYPEVAGHPLGDTAEGHPILIDSGHGSADDPVGVDGVGPQKGRLSSKIVLAR